MTSPKTEPAKCCGQQAFSSLQSLWSQKSLPALSPISVLPSTDSQILAASPSQSGNVLYLAYASNLSSETFRGARGIKPLSCINVHVPTLDLTFDLPALPYTDPCMGNTRIRDPFKPSPPSKYRKDAWKKGLIGVVYEVTPEDYRTIIATEGGGASYHDILVDCFVIPRGTKRVSDAPPREGAFKAHTLFSPADSPDKKSPHRIQRPDPSYAQPSVRYLKLITDGAEEHSLPPDYLAYLHNIRTYTITTYRQQLGKAIFMAFGLLVIMPIFTLGGRFADKDGKIPRWVATILGLVFRLMWNLYDGGLSKVFGDGERTIGDDNDSVDEEKGCTRWLNEKCANMDEKVALSVEQE